MTHLVPNFNSDDLPQTDKTPDDGGLKSCKASEHLQCTERTADRIWMGRNKEEVRSDKKRNQTRGTLTTRTQSNLQGYIYRPMELKNTQIHHNTHRDDVCELHKGRQR